MTRGVDVAENGVLLADDRFDYKRLNLPTWHGKREIMRQFTIER
jgi:hypothetical protein